MVQSQARVKKHAKPLTKQGLYKHLRKLGIKRLGEARPAIYANDTADRVIARLGFQLPKRNGHHKQNGKGQR